jgi:hypothetical protein
MTAHPQNISLAWRIVPVTQKGRSEHIENTQIQENNSQSAKHTKERQVCQLKQGNRDKRTAWRMRRFFERGGDSQNTKRK